MSGFQQAYSKALTISESGGSSDASRAALAACKKKQQDAESRRRECNSACEKC